MTWEYFEKLGSILVVMQLAKELLCKVTKLRYSNNIHIISCTGTIPTALAAKCESDICTTLTTETTAVKSCLTDPTATACTGTYSWLQFLHKTHP